MNLNERINEMVNEMINLKEEVIATEGETIIVTPSSDDVKKILKDFLKTPPAQKKSIWKNSLNDYLEEIQSSDLHPYTLLGNILASNYAERKERYVSRKKYIVT